MTTIEKSVDVQVPVRTAYDQWTRFESFPMFMEGVERVTQLGDSVTHWETSIGGVRREFDARITEQRPDECVAWSTMDGPRHSGAVTFRPTGDRSTRVTLRMEYHPDTLTERAATAMGVVEARIDGDLRRFSTFIEEQGRATGGWRGEVNPSGAPTREVPGPAGPHDPVVRRPGL